jgi:hypothetical protein
MSLRAFGRAALALLTVLVSALLPQCASAARAKSAVRAVLWTRCDQIVGLSDAQLDQWRARGVGGFVCATSQLYEMGGSQQWTADHNADLSGPEFSLQRSIRDSNIVARASTRGMKLYLGFYLVNYWNRATPLADWYDDAAWSGTVLPQVRNIAGAANQLGFAGLAFDGELYPQYGAYTATWSARYPGNLHDVAGTRAMVKKRGADLMRTVVGAFPGVEVANSHLQFPDSWWGVVERQVNGDRAFAADSVMPSFWDGITSVEGYTAIRFYDDVFYKTPHIPYSTWDTANQYNANAFYASLSRKWSNWRYASSRFHVSPFVWIDNGATAFSAARPPDYVAKQLAAARRWATGEYAIYAEQPLSAFDYTPYVAAMKAAGRPGTVDSEAPRLTIRTSRATMTGATSLAICGTASDNMAIRDVRWKNDRGGSGTARMTWHVVSGDWRSRYKSRMEWTIRRISVRPGANRITVTADDANGLRTSKFLIVTSASGTVRSRARVVGERGRARQHGRAGRVSQVPAARELRRGPCGTSPGRGPSTAA